MPRWIALMLSICLLWSALNVALAEDCFTLDMDALDMNRLRDPDYLAQALTSPASGLCVRKYVSDSDELAARVRLTVTQAEDGALVFDKSYGYQSGTFDSGALYLPYVDNRTIPYIVTLYVEDWVYAVPYLHSLPRLRRNSGCTWGVRMRDYGSPTDDWRMGTMLDLDALRAQGGVRMLPLCASNLYIVGQATVWLDGDRLSVSLSFDAAANAEVHSAAVYCVTDVSALSSGDPERAGLPAHAPGESIDVSGASSALLYVPLTLSYDPQGLAPFAYDLSDGELQSELALWRQNAEAQTDEAPICPPEAMIDFVVEPEEITDFPEVVEEPDTPQTNG